MEAIIDLIISEKITAFCLQDVGQAATGRIVTQSKLQQLHFMAAEKGEDTVRISNFAFLLQRELQKIKISFSWTWVATHVTSKNVTEGLAIFSKVPFTAVRAKLLTEEITYREQQCRKGLAAYLEDGRILANVHFSRQYEQFLLEWNKMTMWLKTIKKNNPLFLMGAFNIDAESNIAGYKKICESFQDTYATALSRGDGLTIRGAVNGWQDNQIGKRTDYILASPAQPIISSRIYFEGDLTPRISSHAGVVIETDDLTYTKSTGKVAQ
ncbi:endonuclease exonuclease phosphatase family protein [Liquorilactobacillus capillatus DSM 19910]|uniref:Endonuclease exonuclease phosphatase family protein n=1 Tax=Liquorilactobacillus capillatus DSM 19910 TaxID=1423731 RepID=A0A0R1MB49_9LACO|nr:endonuclease exonuclease phosphatase family protein [Liquorilactobacillus capillatus DSM 19910]